MHRSTAHNYGALTASPSVFEENESCGDACARQLPSLEWIKAYDFAWLWNDVAGGITLGLVLLAQSLAHAHLCGVAPIRGPYACLLAPLAYALLGTCHEASIGTGGLVSLVVSEQLAREYATPEERFAAERSGGKRVRPTKDKRIQPALTYNSSEDDDDLIINENTGMSDMLLEDEWTIEDEWNKGDDDDWSN